MMVNLPRPDLLIVGAGPAGMSAALEAASRGLAVGVLDDQPRPGGMLFRGAGGRPADWAAAEAHILGDSYARTGREITKRFLAAEGIDYCPGSNVLNVDRSGQLTYRDAAGQVRMVQAGRVMLATGATERATPFPGWTLPGVMTAGAAQVLIKDAGLRPDGRIVLAGTGPLLLLVAAELVKAGNSPVAILQTSHKPSILSGIRSLLARKGGLGLALRGQHMLLELRRAGVPILAGATDVKVLGTDRITGVTARVDDRETSFEADVLLIHSGIAPNDLLAKVARVDLEWDIPNNGWNVVHDDWGNCSVDTIAVAGDCAGILGGEAAMISGRLAGLEAAYRAGNLAQADRDSKAVPMLATLAKHRKARRFVTDLYPQPDHLTMADDATLICRCEAVTLGSIREAVANGCNGPNQVKAVTRCGMGQCQGRQCGGPLAEAVARAIGTPVDQVPAHRARPPLGYVTMGEMATMSRETAE